MSKSTVSMACSAQRAGTSPGASPASHCSSVMRPIVARNISHARSNCSLRSEAIVFIGDILLFALVRTAAQEPLLPRPIPGRLSTPETGPPGQPRPLRPLPLPIYRADIHSDAEVALNRSSRSRPPAHAATRDIRASRLAPPNRLSDKALGAELGRPRRHVRPAVRLRHGGREVILRWTAVKPALNMRRSVRICFGHSGAHDALKCLLVWHTLRAGLVAGVPYQGDRPGSGIAQPYPMVRLQGRVDALTYEEPEQPFALRDCSHVNRLARVCVRINAHEHTARTIAPRLAGNVRGLGYECGLNLLGHLLPGHLRDARLQKQPALQSIGLPNEVVPATATDAHTIEIPNDNLSGGVTRRLRPACRLRHPCQKRPIQVALTQHNDLDLASVFPIHLRSSSISPRRNAASVPGISRCVIIPFSSRTRWTESRLRASAFSASAIR